MARLVRPYSLLDTTFMIKHSFIYSLALVLLLSLAPLSSHAASASGAGDFVRGIVDKTITLIKSENLSASDKEQQLTQVFLDNVDTTWMARFVMGRYWKDTDTTQRNHYHQLYQKFLVMSYVPRFQEYTDQNIELRNTRSEGKNEFLVETRIISSTTAQPIRVNYKIRHQDGAYKVFDIIAEGVSLIGVQRSDFGSIINRSGVDGLISALERKTDS